MLKVVLLQAVAAVLGVLIGWAWLGPLGAYSALCGGAAIVIPSCFFAWRLSQVARRGARSSTSGAHVSAFLIGEFVKIASAIGILVLVRLLFPGAQWGAVVLGMIVTLQANFLAFLVKP